MLPELALEAALGDASLGALMSQPEVLVGAVLLGLALSPGSPFGKRGAAVTAPDRGLLSELVSDLTKVSDLRRWHPTPSSQPDLGWNLDGTPVPSVVPLEDVLLPRPGRGPRVTRPGASPWVQPARQSRITHGYAYAQVSPRDVVDCVRRYRRRRVLFSRGKLYSRRPRYRRPGAVSCYGY